jgi:hypothetical protein
MSKYHGFKNRAKISDFKMRFKIQLQLNQGLKLYLNLKTIFHLKLKTFAT